MADKTVTLPYNSTDEIKSAATFIAGLIENSTVIFSVEVNGRRMIITFTGGY